MKIATGLQSVSLAPPLPVDQQDKESAETGAPELICTEGDSRSNSPDEKSNRSAPKKKGRVLELVLPSEGALIADVLEEQAN